MQELSPTHRPVRLIRLAPCLLVALMLAALWPVATPVAAASIVVNSLSGQVSDDNDMGTCTLFEAVKAANQDQAVDGCTAGSDTLPDLITFGVTGEIELEGTLFVNSEIAILGPIAITGTGNFALFNVQSSGNLSMSTLTLEDAQNSAIRNTNGTLNIAGVSFVGNESNDGGAINSSGGDAEINIAGSNFVGNEASDQGGAIYSTGGTLTIAASNFNGNVAGNEGGAIFNNNSSNRTSEISDSIFAGNIVEDSNDDRGGGAIANAGNLTVIRTRFDGNLSPMANGGAVANKISGELTIRDGSFNGNLAGTPGTERFGGAVYNQGDLNLLRVLLLASGATGRGGAVASDRGGTVNITNATLTASASGTEGGAIANFNSQSPNAPASTVTIRNATITNSAAMNSGSAIFNESGDTISVGNTIITDSAGDNCNTLLTSLGHNIDSGATCVNDASDLTNTDPQLGGLAFNGGPLATLLSQKLEPGSPAVDAGDPAICSSEPVANQDQRKDPRPLDGDGNGTAICDIGALENETQVAGYGSTPVQPGTIAFGNAVANQESVTASFIVFETGNAPLNVTNPVLGGAHASDFSLGTSLPLTIADGGAQQQIDLTCTPTAIGQRTATLTLNTNDPNVPTASYTLNCNGTDAPAPGFGSQPAAPGPIAIGEAFLNVKTTTLLQVSETGAAPLTVDTPTLSGVNANDFAVDLSVFPLTINDGGAAQNVEVSCTPPVLGIRTATLTLDTNDPNLPMVSFDVSCVGVELPPIAIARPGSNTPNGTSPGNNGPYGIAVSPNGQNVYATDSGDDVLTQFRWQAVTRQLTSQAFYTSLLPNDLNGARNVAISPDGQNAYVASADADTVVAYRRNTNSGLLSKIDTVTEGDAYSCNPLPPNICLILDGLDGAFDVVVSPDGRHVYVSSVNDDAVVVLRRNQEDGSLSTPLFGVNRLQVFTMASELDETTGLAFSPDGKYLYVAGSTSDTLVVLKRDAISGELSLVETVNNLDRVLQLAVSPDGAHLYAVLSNVDTLVAYRIDPLDGSLTELDRYVNGANNISGLADPRGVTVSPDGTYVYVTGYDSDSVAVFARNSTTGLLQQIQVIQPSGGPPPVPPLDGARNVVAHPDGSVVFVTAFLDNVVVALPAANPVPSITSLSPASVAAGGPSLVLTVNGANFLPDSEVLLNGTTRPTTFVNSTRLEAQVTAADIATAASIGIQVTTPEPGGGASGTLPFTVQAPEDNPIPTITALLPQGAPAGVGALIVGIEGAGFLPTSQAQWNGNNRTTTYVSATYLEVQMNASDLAAPGEAGISVVNPTPGGGSSNAATFTIAAPGENPIPAITQLSPAFITAQSLESATLLLTIKGSNFLVDSQVQWNGSDRPTTYVHTTELQVEVTAADLAEIGTADVTVNNPAPGGGTSNAVTFTIGAVGDNPVPGLVGLALTSNGDETFTLTLEGSGFIPTSVIRWNGVDLSTTFGSDTELRATLPLTDLLSGLGVVTVFNPAPGGGTSQSLIYQANGAGPARVFVPIVQR